MDREQVEQEARNHLGEDLVAAYDRALKNSSQEVTQAALVELGVLPEAFVTGECSNALTLLGGVMGSLLDDGAGLADVRDIVLGNRGLLYKLDVALGRRDQIEMFLDFGAVQVARICRPGTTSAVTAAVYSIFSRTVVDIGLQPRPDPL